LDPFEIKLSSNKYFSASPRDYLFDITTTESYFCVVGVTGDSQIDSYVLGTSFLSSYVSIFDLENKKVGIALSGEVLPPTPPQKKKLKVWMIAIIAVGGAAVVLVIVFIVHKVIKNNKDKKNIENRETDASLLYGTRGV
jgi:hypothetical protein